MPAVNYVICGCSSSRTTPGVITIQKIPSGGRILLKLQMVDDNLKRQIKNRTLYNFVDYSYQPEFVNILAIGQYLSNYPNFLFLQYTQSNNFSKFSQINNFSVDYEGLYISWTNTSFSIIPGTLPTLKLPNKSHLLSREILYSNIVLVSNYHGCKGETTKLIPYCVIDII